MKTIFKIKTKILSFTISILGLALLVISITSCSSNTPTDEIPPVAEDSGLINRISRQNWRNNRESYLKSVETNLYEAGGITNTVIGTIKDKNDIITIDKEIFLIQSCQHENTEACSFIDSQLN
ncbi:MAG: hypothetical protein SWZ49_23560 [Cyanobacteriota bacterium]|nr:hypothetical protein [Cyanobacteriota bacterium]